MDDGTFLLLFNCFNTSALINWLKYIFFFFPQIHLNSLYFHGLTLLEHLKMILQSVMYLMPEKINLGKLDCCNYFCVTSLTLQNGKSDHLYWNSTNPQLVMYTSFFSYFNIGYKYLFLLYICPSFQLNYSHILFSYSEC